MNVHTQTLTPAETALIDAHPGLDSILPGDAGTARKREQALDILRSGLPTRRIEAWHYTDLRRLVNSVPDPDPTADAPNVAPLVSGSAVLTVTDGKAGDAPAIGAVSHHAVSVALADGKLSTALAPFDADDAIGAINSAFVSDGYALSVPAGETVAAPVELQNLHGGGQVHTRFPVTVGAGAKVTIVERQTGSAEALVSSVAGIEIAEGAHVTWVILQEQPDDTVHLGQFSARIGKDAHLTLFIMNAGGKVVRQEVRVAADEEGASFKLRGVNLLSGKTHCDVTMVLDHSAPHTESTEIVRNVITDSAHGVFQGQIRVDREAQKTDAKMSCNTLLLSDDGQFSTKPELEIFADDVACGHGATVTEIDAGHLFYLMARGIDEKIARGLLVKAFVAEIIEELDDEKLVESLETKLDGWFAAHG